MAGVGRASRRVRSWWASFVRWVRNRGAPQQAPDAERAGDVRRADPSHGRPAAPANRSPIPLPRLPAPRLRRRRFAQSVETRPRRKPRTDVWRTPLGNPGFHRAERGSVCLPGPDLRLQPRLRSPRCWAWLSDWWSSSSRTARRCSLFSRTHRSGLDVRALPATLIVAVICVLVSRLRASSPAICMAWSSASSLRTACSRTSRARQRPPPRGLADRRVRCMGRRSRSCAAAAHADAFTNALLQAATVTIVVAGLENAVFAMLPLRFLPGAAVYGVEPHRVGRAHRPWPVRLRPRAAQSHRRRWLPCRHDADLFLHDDRVAGRVRLASVLFWAWFRFRPDPHRQEGQAL